MRSIWEGWILLLAVFIGLETNAVQGSKILALLPHPGESHFAFFFPVLEAAAEAGHEVTVIGHFPMENVSKNYVDIPLDVKLSLANSVDLEMFSKRFSFGHFIEFFMLRGWGLESCENALKSTAIQNLIKTKPHFDLIIMENFNNDCMFGVTHRFPNTPIIGLSSCAVMPWFYDRLGSVSNPSLVPALFMGHSDHMTFKQRLANWIAHYGLKWMFRLLTAPPTNTLIRKYIGEDVPDVNELASRTSLMFVNQHYSLSGVKPLGPNVVELGGIHISDTFKPLDKDLKRFLDSADHGVIYISWGSMIRATTLPDEKREAILKALGQFKQKVLWKWENETLPNQPQNVLIRKWMPQKEILCHPKVHVFMGHGGLLGTSEAVYCGVSMVTTPMYGDQFLNSAALENRKMGKVVHYEDLTTENLVRALKFALDPTTQLNAKAVSYSYKNRPQTPKELAVYWINHTIATGGVPLTKSYSSSMPWYIYHGYDIYAVIVAVEIVIIASWVWALKRLCSKKKGGKVKKN